MTTVKASFNGVEFNIPVETAKKVLWLQKIMREQEEKKQEVITKEHRAFFNLKSESK